VDRTTLENPTRSKKDEGARPTSEAAAWPEQADVLALVRGGISYEQAWEMSPLECEKTLSILSAWAIPSDERVGGTVMATPADIDALYGK
jgi:hypothetical protein